jgi:hypothetical protein
MTKPTNGAANRTLPVRCLLYALQWLLYGLARAGRYALEFQDRLAAVRFEFDCATGEFRIVPRVPGLNTWDPEPLPGDPPPAPIPQTPGPREQAHSPEPSRIPASLPVQTRTVGSDGRVLG